MLKAAVTVGQITETDKPMASGRLKRLTKFAMDVLASISPHHEGRHIRVGHEAPADIRHSPVNDGHTLLGLRIAQCQRRSKFQHVAAQSMTRASRSRNEPPLIGLS
jgi:hypothetical protein